MEPSTRRNQQQLAIANLLLRFSAVINLQDIRDCNLALNFLGIGRILSKCSKKVS